jgi:hypothetical protein
MEMSQTHDTVRLETLLALALSDRWPQVRPDDDPNAEVDNSEGKPEEIVDEGTRELPAVLMGLSATDRLATEALLRRFLKLPRKDQARWLDHKLGRITAATPERNRRFERDVHSSQIVEALQDESVRMQSLIASSLPSPQREQVADTIGISLPDVPFDVNSPVGKMALIAREAVLAEFVNTSSIENPSALDLLSCVELARLIRFLGVRETAIACRGIGAVETVTAFLKRFSAEDAHAIVSHLAAQKTIATERIDFAERLAREAIGDDADVASTMLDRIGLALLAIVLRRYETPRLRHITQKLPAEAARQLNDLLATEMECDEQLAREIERDTQSLATNLHRLQWTEEDRRGSPAL